jgi:dephospho-CoA kinase
MIVIGLTGGIGTGKSEVARVLEELGAVRVSADELAHQAYRPGTDTWREVVDAFGEEVLLPSREIDRGKLGPIVFEDPAALARLNAIVHPRIYTMAEAQILQHRAGDAPAVVLEGALLIEAGWTPLVDEVWMTAAPEEQVVERLRARGHRPEEVRARISAQMPATERARHAHVIIENAGDKASLRKRALEVWEQRIPSGKA